MARMFFNYNDMLLFPPPQSMHATGQDQVQRFFPNCSRPTPHVSTGDDVSKSNALSSSNGSSSNSRKRVPVACARCRKRKIRCSGDPGDNRGCQSCKAASVGPGECVFLRVSCQPLSMSDPSSTSATPSSSEYRHPGTYASDYSTPSHLLCSSAPATLAGMSFEQHMQHALPFSHPNGLQQSKSLSSIQTLARKTFPSKHQLMIPMARDESGLALLAKHAEPMASSESLHESYSNVPFVSCVVSGLNDSTINSSYNVPGWASQVNTENIESNSEARKYSVENGDKAFATQVAPSLYLQSGFPQDYNGATGLFQTQHFIPTSHIRDPINPDHDKYLSSRVDQLNLSFPQSVATGTTVVKRNAQDDRSFMPPPPTFAVSGSHKADQYTSSASSNAINLDEDHSAISSSPVPNYGQYTSSSLNPPISEAYQAPAAGSFKMLPVSRISPKSSNYASSPSSDSQSQRSSSSGSLLRKSPVSVTTSHSSSRTIPGTASRPSSSGCGSTMVHNESFGYDSNATYDHCFSMRQQSICGKQ